MADNIIPYNPKLIPIARRLRNNSTFSEVLMWMRLQNKQFMGYDFDRQKPVGNYIVDFYCQELMLAIEIDGASHDRKSKEDLVRQQKIESFGITIIRFTNLAVKQHIIEVLEQLRWQVRQLE
jgi:very-short-patch-repair endonuclease